MGALWGSFGVIGIFFPLLVLAGTAAYVFGLSRKIRRIDSGRMRRPAVPVLYHVGLVMAVDVTLELLNFVLSPGLPRPVLIGVMIVKPVLRMASLALVPVWLHRKLSTLAPKEERPGPADDPVRQRHKAVRVAWVIVISGVLLPWLVAVGVKLYLSAVDRPTLPFSSFLNPSFPALLGASLVQWSFPFVILGLVVRFRSSGKGKLSFSERLKLAWIVHTTGLAAGGLLFWGVFWDFDFMYLFVPLGLFLVPPMLVAYWVGRPLMRKRTPV